MRAISAADEALLSKTGVTKRFRVQVKDSGGTFRDLTTWAGPNFVVAATWNEGIDSNGLDAAIDIKRAVDSFLSAAPLMTKSPLNLGFVYPGTYAPLLELGRDVQIDRALVPEGTSTFTWVKAFGGVIDGINPAGDGGHIKITARGTFAKAIDTFIENERVYAYSVDADATKGFLLWQPSRLTVLNDQSLPSEAKRNGHFYQATSITTGITASTEPAWPTGAGATVVDGGVTWTEKGLTTTTTGTAVETVMQRILNDNMASPPTLNTPVSPAWAIKFYKQDRVSTWQALRTLADQIGWDLRDFWHAGSSDFRLELRAVDRAKTTPDRTFGPGDRFELKRLETKLEGIRNVVRIIFSDSQDLDAGGHPKRKTLERTNATSITRYGRRFMEIAEADVSNIDTTAEATAMADAVLSDLSSPLAEQECELPFFPFVELGDLYRFTADGVHYDTDQDLAVVQYRHSFSGGSSPKARTMLLCRGKPSGGYKRWLSQEAGRNSEVHALDLLSTSVVSFSATDAIGGVNLRIGGDEYKKALNRNYEIHVSQTPGFTPNPASLVAKGQQTEMLLGDLIPAETYYMRVIPFGFNASKMVRGQPSAETSFVAGRASTGHIHGGIALGDYPLNGGFETRLNAASLPDHWSLYSGAYSTNVEVMEDGNGMSGRRYVRMKNGGVRSAIFPMIQEAHESNRRGSLYRFHWWRKAGSSASAYSALIRLLDYQDGEVVILTVGGSMPADKAGHWVLEELFCRLKEGDASARGLQLQISGGGTGANQQIDIDEVRCQFLGTPWYEVGDTTRFTQNYEAIPGFANSWVNYDATNESKAAFRKDQFGRVEPKGIIKDGTVGSVPCWTLPVGFRPPKPLRFACMTASAAPAHVEIRTNGEIWIVSGDNTWVDLSGIVPFMTTHVASTTT